jgi:hypothetical protein
MLEILFLKKWKIKDSLLFANLRNKREPFVRDFRQNVKNRQS